MRSVKALQYLKYDQKIRLFQNFQTSQTFDEYRCYDFLFFLYQQQYFSSIYKTPVLLQNINTLNVVPYSILKYLVNSIKHVK